MLGFKADNMSHVSYIVFDIDLISSYTNNSLLLESNLISFATGNLSALFNILSRADVAGTSITISSAYTNAATNVFPI